MKSVSIYLVRRRVGIHVAKQRCTLEAPGDRRVVAKQLHEEVKVQRVVFYLGAMRFYKERERERAEFYVCVRNISPHG